MRGRIFEFEYKGERFVLDVDSLLTVSNENLAQDIKDHALLSYDIFDLYEVFERDRELAEYELESLKASKWVAFKKGESGKSCSDALAQALVKSDPEVAEMEKKVIELRSITRRLKELNFLQKSKKDLMTLYVNSIKFAV